MTNEELTAIEKRANAATREPWIVGDAYVPAISSAVSVYGMGMEVAECQMDTDAAFISAARVDVPALVAEVRRLRAERDALRTDAALLDALQAEHERFDPVAALVVKVKHDRNSSDWANVVGDVRAALNAALSALAVQP